MSRYTDLEQRLLDYILDNRYYYGMNFNSVDSFKRMPADIRSHAEAREREADYVRKKALEKLTVEERRVLKV